MCILYSAILVEKVLEKDHANIFAKLQPNLLAVQGAFTWLCLSGPDLICDFSYELQLLLHALNVNQIALCMTRKATLWADASPLQRLFPSFTVSLCHDISRCVDPLLQLLLIFQLWELARDHTQNDILVLRQVCEWLEATSARRIILKVVCMDIHALEQLCRDSVVAAFAEMARVDEVAAAEVHADVHVGGDLRDALVVELDV